MSGKERRGRRAPRSASTAKRIFGTMAAAGAEAYLRSRDLPRLIALWPHELDDQTPEGGLHVLAKLRRALRAERRRALSGHWSYDLNRHLGLLSAYKGELARLRLGPSGPQPYDTRRGRERGCG
jgi:Family of unknown function (DUF6477)